MTDIPADDPPLLPPGWNWEQSEKGMWMAVPPPPDHGTSLHEWPASIELAWKDNLLQYEALMLQADANEQATANDPFSQEIARIGDSESPDGPKLIVRFLKHGTFGKRSCDPGEVWPVDKERALSLLLHVPQTVELATPEELKRDRDLIPQIEPSAKAQVEENRRQRIQDGIYLELPEKLIVRLLRSDRFAIHFKQGIIYEKRGADCQMYPCEAGEVWEVEYGFAHILLRGKSPTAELATEADLKACIAKLGAGSETEEKPDQPVAGSKSKPVKPKKPKKPKKSRSPGPAELKIQKALIRHHKYSDGSCLNYGSIGSNALALLADVGKGSPTNFFNKYFGGFPEYEKACHLGRPLAVKLALLERDFRSLRELPLPDGI